MYQEFSHFNSEENDWWDSFEGHLKTLHEINPARVKFILEESQSFFATRKDPRKIRVLDVGCGGGLISIPLARAGMQVLGIDPSSRAIKQARDKSEDLVNAPQYSVIDLENFANSRKKFDLVVCMDVIEHVENVSIALLHLRKLVKPAGMIILSTINKTLKAGLVAIALAEYILNVIPLGTHQYSSFIKPSFLKTKFEELEFTFRSIKGINYSFQKACWDLGGDLSVNYIVSIAKTNY